MFVHVANASLVIVDGAPVRGRAKLVSLPGDQHKTDKDYSFRVSVATPQRQPSQLIHLAILLIYLLNNDSREVWYCQIESAL